MTYRWLCTVACALMTLACDETGPVGGPRCLFSDAPTEIAVTNVDKVDMLFVVDRDENKLLLVSASDLEVVAEIAVGQQPHGVAYRP